MQGLAFSLGLIEGGIRPNIIADHASVKFGFRPLPGQSVENLLSDLDQIVNFLLIVQAEV